MELTTRRFVMASAALAMGVGLSACENPNWTTYNPLDKRVTVAGANPLVDSDKFEPIDLVSLLDPKDYGWTGVKISRKNSGGKPVLSPSEQKSEQEKVMFAFEGFYDPRYDTTPPEERRNRVQERILGSSRQRCNIFKLYLQRLRSETNLLLGAISTITGVTGSIVSGAGAARALAGTSGIFSGIQAEFNQQLFQNLATQVITAAIDLRQREIYEQIVAKGQSKSIEQYNVQAAVKDAIYFHAQCSVITGFEVAKDSIKLIEDPGAAAANRIIAKFRLTRKLLDGRELTDEDKANLTSPMGTLLFVGTNLKSRDDPDLPTAALATAMLAIERAVVAFGGWIGGQKALSKDDKKKINDAAKAALTSAREGLEKHLMPAFGLTAEVLKARAAVAAANDDQESLPTLTAMLKKARLKGRGKSREILATQKNLSIMLDEARELLEAGIKALKEGETLDGKIIKKAKDALEK